MSQYLVHFRYGETEAQRGDCPRLQSWETAALSKDSGKDRCMAPMNGIRVPDPSHLR
jgi:hypothetical protein